MPILLALLLAPFIEIAGFVWLGPYLGVAGTLAFVLVSAFIGLSLLRSQGLAALTRLQREIDTGSAPLQAALDGALRIIAALLLIVPGFFSTGLGLVLLVPPVRAVVVARAERRLAAGGSVWIIRTGSPRKSDPGVIDGDFREVPTEPPREIR